MNFGVGSHANCNLCSEASSALEADVDEGRAPNIIAAVEADKQFAIPKSNNDPHLPPDSITPVLIAKNYSRLVRGTQSVRDHGTHRSIPRRKWQRRVSSPALEQL
jgi:hypothetical protein